MGKIASFVRTAMFHVAGFIDYWTKGNVKPAHITALSLLGHIPVAWALVVNRPVLAAVLLAGFSLLDALDGAMARVQNSASRTGMYFDAVSDRLKEVILYTALGVYALKHLDQQEVWLIIALAGTSLLVSYTKAKGEMAIASSASNVQKLNRQFGVGIASYEIRMIAIIIGLLFGILPLILPLLVAANLLTIAVRFIVVSRELYVLDENDKQKTTKKKKSTS